jgi:hypothetical protein
MGFELSKLHPKPKALQSTIGIHLFYPTLFKLAWLKASHGTLIWWVQPLSLIKSPNIFANTISSEAFKKMSKIHILSNLCEFLALSVCLEWGVLTNILLTYYLCTFNTNFIIFRNVEILKNNFFSNYKILWKKILIIKKKFKNLEWKFQILVKLFNKHVSKHQGIMVPTLAQWVIKLFIDSKITL